MKSLSTSPQVPKVFFAGDLTGYGENKEKFHRDAKKFLKEVASAMGLQEGQYDLRSNKAGPGVSGEITLHSDNMYIQVMESLSGSGASILYRSCDNRRDYRGHHNNFIHNESLAGMDFDTIIERFESVRKAALKRSVAGPSL